MNGTPPKSLAEAFIGQLERRPNAPALVDPASPGQRSLSWSDLACAVGDVLQLFDAWNLRRCDHVATWLPNSLAWIAVDLAAQLRGIVHVALDTRLPASTVARLTEHASARLLVASDPLRSDLPTEAFASAPCYLVAPPDFSSLQCNAVGAEASALGNSAHEDPRSQAARQLLCGGDEVQSEAAAQILYTSGTMSAPKGVVLSNRNLLTNALAKLGAAPQFHTDIRLNVLPFSHAYARTCELSTWLLSGSQLILAADWRMFLEIGPNTRPTLINLVPHLAYKLADLIDDRSSPLGDRVRLLQVGGAALTRRAWERLAAAGWPPLQGYGLTECSPVICSNRAGSQRPDTVGPPVDGVEVQIDEQGVLWTRGAHVMLGYWRQPQETLARFKDGWFCTQDLAEWDSDGHLRIIGRNDDRITLSTGYKLSPYEITSRLAHDPWIESLVIVGQNRPYIAALVCPNFDSLPYEFYDDMRVRNFDSLNAARLVAELGRRWSERLVDLPKHMQVSAISLLREPLQYSDGGLNFKGGIRRKFIEEELMRDQIDALYRLQIEPQSTRRDAE